ncbi:hypothetical protein [Amycolatopsis sp. GM8]|uniref:hypothetical protein n=1 Tax=Amycolatopsis sp. GM8 TaxID=2896530 RepID=UPI001F36C5C5|nr:hypothetical protein [Amycolatopsis sp. GM8]
MGHKGIRDGGPARTPGFRPEDVVGLPIRRALIDLSHQGFDAEIVDGREHQPRTLTWISSRVHLVVDDGVVVQVFRG